MNVKDIQQAHEEVQAALDRGAQGILVVALYPDSTRIAHCGDGTVQSLAMTVAMLQHDIHHILCDGGDADDNGGDDEKESA